jgi:hypothetical protein
MNKQEISVKLLENHQNFADFLMGLSEPDFMFAPAGKWTAGQQFDHIVRGVSPVSTALALPKFVPNLLFGKSDRYSIDFETLVKNYQAKLAGGGKASGTFIPPEIGFEQRESLKEKLLKTVAELTKRIDKFSEAQLDEYILPHPILGKLTIREMLYFTIYHVEHHHQRAVENLENK